MNTIPTAQPALDRLSAMIATLAAAVVASDLYLTSYDTSAPSRIKAMTRLAVEEAMALIRPQAEALCSACKQPQSTPSCDRREHWGA